MPRGLSSHNDDGRQMVLFSRHFGNEFKTVGPPYLSRSLTVLLLSLASRNSEGQFQIFSAAGVALNREL